MKTLAIVPAYNEAHNIIFVINDLYEHHPEIDILIVNDCSLDKTGSLAESTKKASVVNVPINLGIGGGVQTGFLYAVRNGYDIALQFDGDGQHLASEIDKIINPVINEEADVVVGSRFCESNDGFRSTFLRRVGIRFFELLNSILIKQRITDNTSGFRAYNKEAFTFLADNYPRDYPEPEAIVLLGKNGFSIKEVFTYMQERQGGKSSIYGLRSAFYMIKVVFGVLMTFSRKNNRSQT